MPYKKKKPRKIKLLSSRAGWAIFVAVFICMAAVIWSSLLASERFDPIAYVPPGEGELLAQDNISGKTSDYNNESGDNETLEQTPMLPQELFLPVPNTLSQEEKLSLIKRKYINIFTNLESAYQRELDRLVNSAKADYIAIKNGKKDMSLTRLAREYISAGKNLEKQADHNFSQVLGEMKEELKEHNLSTDLAKQAEEEYKRQKSEMRKVMLKQVASYIND